MGKEEQVEEREVLDSIFPEEITGQLHRTTTDYPATKTDHASPD